MSAPLLRGAGRGGSFDRTAVLEDVSFELHAGETLGLVGESGAGKSTLARAILRLVAATRGAVWWQDEDLLRLGAQALRARRRDLQIIFQDPAGSLDPLMTVEQILGEPLRLFEPALDAAERRRHIGEMLERVGLSAAARCRYPHEFSGGQCQRIGIARAMLTRPRLLVCDEPVSSLDLSVQGQIVNLLMDLQAQSGTALLFISHNLAVVRHISHRVLVLYAGRVVESAPRERLFTAAAHPYTRLLLAAMIDPQRALERRRRADAGARGAADEPPLSAQLGAGGCAFRGRCPQARALCAEAPPRLEAVAPGQWVACHRWRELVYSSPHETA